MKDDQPTIVINFKCPLNNRNKLEEIVHKKRISTHPKFTVTKLLNEMIEDFLKNKP